MKIIIATKVYGIDYVILPREQYFSSFESRLRGLSRRVCCTNTLGSKTREQILQEKWKNLTVRPGMIPEEGTVQNIIFGIHTNKYNVTDLHNDTGCY